MSWWQLHTQVSQYNILGSCPHAYKGMNVQSLRKQLAEQNVNVLAFIEVWDLSYSLAPSMSFSLDSRGHFY